MSRVRTRRTFEPVAARRSGRLTGGGYERPLYEQPWDEEPVVTGHHRPKFTEWSEFDLLPRFPAWMKDAACVETPTVGFFADGRGRGGYDSAKRVCSRCLVADECLNFALVESIPSGMWGGMTPDERKALGYRPEDDPDGVVYFAVGSDPDLIKIGTSRDPGRRMYSLGCRLLATEPGYFNRERELHKRFAHLRLTPRGEWFLADDDLLAYIDSLNAEQVAA